jgi:hypothetical protein
VSVENLEVVRVHADVLACHLSTTELMYCDPAMLTFFQTCELFAL